jgi:putative ABC transport system permease protein
MNAGRRLIGWLAPAELRQALLDDLDETSARETAGRSAGSAAWWRARQSVSAVIEVLKLRARRRLDQAGDGLGRPPLGRAFLRDARHAGRLLRRAPVFTLMAVGTLALGIGANTAIFSLVKTVLLQPLPYGDPNRLVMIWNPDLATEPTWLAAPEVASYRQQAKSLAKLGVYTTVDGNLTGGTEPERVHLGVASGDLFDVLQVTPLAGRALQIADADPGAAPVIVLGEGIWKRRFGGSAAAVGQPIQLNGRPYQVVGVMPASFRLPLEYRGDQPTEAWIPLVLSPPTLNNWGDHSYFGVARLAPGVSATAVAPELRGIENQWVRDGHRKDPGNDRWHRAALPLHDFLSGSARRPLFILFGAVAGVLLIACANVVNLLLVRSDSRRHEVLVRASLGAERGALVRQALTESLVLSLVGAGLGVGLARLSLQTLLALRPTALPRLGEAGIDAGVLAFTAAVAVLAALVSGVGPAVQFARTNLADALRDGGRSNTPGRARLAVRRLLVVAQLACSVVLVVAAGLLLRTLAELSRVDLGFTPDHVLTAQMQLPPTWYPADTGVVALYRTVVDRLEEAPGVVSAAAIRVLPLSRIIGNWTITVEGRPTGPTENPNADFQWATPDYFRTIGATLDRGRLFTAADREQTPLVAVINEMMAHRYWPTTDAVGRRFKMGDMNQPWMTVIGVIKNTHANSFVEPPRAEMYLLHSQLPETVGGSARGMDLVIRTTGDPVAFAGTLRAIVHELDPRLALAQVRPLDAVVGESLSAPRFAAILLGVFAGLALVLAAIGTYGTMALLVSTRTSEIGIRLALGARRGAIFRLIVGHGLALAAMGIGLGIAGAIAASRVLETLLYGVRPLDPVTFLATPAILGLLAGLACAIPARRAARLDPVTTMRGA